jgi:hypothetical protein
MKNMNVHRCGVLELELQSKCPPPLFDSDREITTTFTGPSGQTMSIRAFWDGGSTWRVRFSPEELGAWTWQTRDSAGDVSKFENANGAFECTEYLGENALYRHGPLKLADNRRTLVHEDGTPFFWLADTAWNGVIRGDDQDWQEYLSTRAEQRFNVIQLVSSQWRGAPLDAAGEPSYFEDGDSIRINPNYFQRLDRRIAMINELGLVAAPVALWSLQKTDPGYALKEADATRLAAYIVSRYDAYQVIWLLGGDGSYQEIGVERWKRMGQSVFSCGHNRLCSLHPCGMNWVGEEFRNEDWYDIISYQSGHGDGDQDLHWLVDGPPASSWDATSPLPIINMEPNYETAYGYQHGTVFTDYHVRRAAYWSLLASPPAGITYGHDSIWNWNSKTGPSVGHGDWHDGAVPPWRTGLDSAGIRSMGVLRNIFERLDWTTMTPARSVLAEASQSKDLQRFIAVGRTADGTIVIYSPTGGTVSLAAGTEISGPLYFVDPRTGDSMPVRDKVAGQIDFPDDRDWLAICGKGWQQ